MRSSSSESQCLIYILLVILVDDFLLCWQQNCMTTDHGALIKSRINRTEFEWQMRWNHILYKLSLISCAGNSEFLWNYCYLSYKHVVGVRKKITHCGVFVVVLSKSHAFHWYSDKENFSPQQIIQPDHALLLFTAHNHCSGDLLCSHSIWPCWSNKNRERVCN